MGRNRGTGIGTHEGRAAIAIAMTFVAALASGCTGQAASGEPTTTQVAAALTGTATISGTASGPGGHLSGIKIEPQRQRPGRDLHGRQRPICVHRARAGTQLLRLRERDRMQLLGDAQLQQSAGEPDRRLRRNRGQLRRRPGRSGTARPARTDGPRRPGGRHRPGRSDRSDRPCRTSRNTGRARPRGPDRPDGTPRREQARPGPSDRQERQERRALPARRAPPARRVRRARLARRVPPARLVRPGDGGQDPRFGNNTGNGNVGNGATCTLGQILLSAAPNLTVGGLPANGQILSISQNTALFSLDRDDLRRRWENDVRSARHAEHHPEQHELLDLHAGHLPQSELRGTPSNRLRWSPELSVTSGAAPAARASDAVSGGTARRG